MLRILPSPLTAGKPCVEGRKLALANMCFSHEYLCMRPAEAHRTTVAPKSHTWIVLLLALPILLSAASTSAASRQAQEKAARKACLTGDYAKGIELLSDLFVDTRDANYIYNQARCYQQNRRYEEAIARFQEYLRAAGPELNPAERASAEKNIADCQALVPKEAARPAPPESQPTKPPTTPQPRPEPPPLPEAVTVQEAPPRSTGAPGSGLRTAGIVTASVGAAGLLAGILLNLKVNTMADELEAYGGYSSDKESDRKTYTMLGWASYGVGAACIGTGALLYYLGLRAANHGPSSVALLPIVASDRAGAAIGGSF
jgi:tetratricopeptide (TPR) repeat protein